MMRFLKRAALWVVLLFFSFFCGLATWGLVFSDRERQAQVSFSACYGGNAVSLIFAYVPRMHWVDQEHGPEVFRMRLRAATIPGVIFSLTQAPVCPNASQKEIEQHARRFWSEKTHKEALDSGVISALIEGYENAENERRKRGGRVLDDEPQDDPTEESPGEDSDTVMPEDEEEENAPLDPANKARSI